MCSLIYCSNQFWWRCGLLHCDSFQLCTDYLFTLKGRDIVNDIASAGSCARRNRSYPYRDQLEQDVSTFLGKIFHLISLFICKLLIVVHSPLHCSIVGFSAIKIRIHVFFLEIVVKYRFNSIFILESWMRKCISSGLVLVVPLSVIWNSLFCRFRSCRRN